MEEFGSRAGPADIRIELMEELLGKMEDIVEFAMEATGLADDTVELPEE
jgi:hypothetical protein